MINSKLQSQFSDYKTLNAPTVEVEVELRPSKLVPTLAKCYVTELWRVAGPVGERLLSGVDVDMVSKYLSTLSWMRCCHSVSARAGSYLNYTRLYRKLAVPVLAYQFLIGIGEAIDRDYSIKFVPTTTIREKELLSPEEMLELSNLFFNLQNSGFKVVAGLPNDPEGELDFMAMCHVGEQVQSYRKSHPVYGFLASFFAQQELNQVTGMMCRILYGYDSDYEVNVSRLVTSIGGSE
jgi:hypothetical protein